MKDRMELRAQVMATIIEDMRADSATGLDPVEQAVKRGIHEMVAKEAFVDLECEDIEAWWTKVERTIDGEVIRSALAKDGDED